MTKNNIEIGVKLVADPASAEEVKQDITKKVASLQAAANQVKGKKGEGIRINLSSLMKEANAIDVSEASKDPIAFTQTLSDFYEKIAKNAKTTYLSLEKKQKKVAKELTDLQNQSEAANKSLLDSQNAYENVKNKGLKKDDSGKKIHDSDFRIGAYDKEKGTEGFFGVSKAYASASVVQDIASTHNLSGINTRADLFKLAKEQPENKNVQDAVEEVNKAEKDFKEKINKAADAQQDAAKSANEYGEALKEATAKISTKNKKDSKTLDILKESTNKSIDFKKVSQKAKSEKKQQKSEIDAKIASDQNKLEELQNTGEKNDNVVTKAIKSFFGYQQVIRALRTVVNFTVKTISDLDKALTDQAIVSGLTRKQVWGLVQSYSDLAKQTGFTTTEIAQTASKFLQQGKTVQETLTLTKAAAESARVAGISASQAVDYLTTALNGFQMSANQSLEVSDKFAALAAASATSYDELAVSLSKVASQANLAGMSMDYTLALLAKGIETTRESAESIGTALKTVIARMREITDYGSTLEDGTDVNNVETQLKAVGISLRNNSGELRSTEDVLNELGLKWSGLSSNQQAALAKALAGTRQQSRLISMMNDYDRTLELLEVSQNSLGATEAQQMKYMQGMAAATNSVQVAWQDLTTTFVNSDAVIGTVSYFANVINELKDNMSAVAIVLGVLGVALAFYNGMLGVTSGLELSNIAITQAGATQKEIDAALELRKQALMKSGIFALIGYAYSENKKNQAAGSSVRIGLFQILALKGLFGAEIQKSAADAVATKTQWKLNEAMSANPVGAIIIAVVALVAILAVLTVAIVLLVKAFGDHRTAVEKSTDRMKKLTAEAYNFRKTASDFDSVVNAFEKVDDKIIKTADDMKSLSDASSKAKELLNNLNTSDDRNSELLKAIFGTDKKEDITNTINNASPAQLEALSKAASKESKRMAIEKNQQVLQEAQDQGVGTKERLNLTKNATAQIGYDSLQTIGEAANMSTEEITNLSLAWQQMVDNMDESDFAGKTKEQMAKMGEDFANYMKGIDSDVIATFFDSSATVKDRLQSYEEITKNMSAEMKANFAAAYPEFGALITNFNKTISNGTLDALGISLESLNKYAKAIEDVTKGMSESSKDSMLDEMGKMIEKGASFEEIAAMLESEFGRTAEEATTIVTAMGKAAAHDKTILDSTQQQSKLSSQASNLRSTQSKWNTMSDSEKAEYIAQHSDFFKDANARNAFENGQDITPYIKKTYAESEAKLKAQYRGQMDQARGEALKAEADIQKAIENGDEAAKAAAIKRKETAEEEYREASQFYKDLDSVFDLSLDEIVKKQQSQISTYKDFLKQQQSDLIDSLNARKQAYQDYFDAINAAYDEQNFASEEQRIQEQIVKFSTGTDAVSQNKVLELTNKLSELQKNHSEEQRKKSQEAVLNNIDDEISKINDYYDKVLNNNKEMLALMNQWLAGGKSRDEYKAYLDKLGYTNEEKEQSLKTFDTLYADGKGAGTWMNDPENTKATEANTTELKKSNQLASVMQQLQVAKWASEMVDSTGKAAEIKTDAKTGDTIVNFAGQTYDLSQADGDQMSKMLLQMLKNARFATKV